MKKMTFLILALITMVACKNNEKTENETIVKEVITRETAKTSVLEIGCYEYNSNGDVIKMEITEINKNLTGNLNFAYAKKDANKGKFVGTLTGNKIIGVYTFISEGVESTRELAFVFKDNQLIEGYGDLNEDGTKFKDTNAINYTSKMPLAKIVCTK